MTPRPISTALTACRLITAWASRPSRRSSQLTWVPTPGGRPCTTTSKTPPTVSPVRRTASTSAFMRASSSGSTQFSRTSSFCESATISSHCAGRRELGLADADDVARDLDAQRAEQQLGERAARPRGPWTLAGAGALQHIAGIGEVVLQGSGEVGVAGPRRRRRPCALRSRPSSTGRISVQFFQSLLAIVIAMGEPMVLP